MENSSNQKKDLYAAVTKFFLLPDGRFTTRVLVGTTNDCRTAEFLFESEIAHRWTSHGSYCGHPKGLIVLENRKVFDIETSSIDGKRVFIFLYDLAAPFWRRQTATKALLEAGQTSSKEDLQAALDVAADLGARYPRMYWYSTKDAYLESLRLAAISLSTADVEGLADLLLDPAVSQAA